MADALLKRILERYRTSGDFNGLYFKGEDSGERQTAIELVREGIVQVVSEKDYPNPHIRPWPSRRTVEQQVASLESLEPDSYGVCLYPTPTALARHRTRGTYPDQPFRQAMAKGRGTLELAYFGFDVLEQYRNDPRFSFDFHDFGVRTVISDDAYLDDAEPEHDKIIMDHIGFAYDLSQYNRDDPSSPLIRRVCAFYGDLAKLSAVHQQRWKTYQVEDADLKPHHVWWMQQMGHWADGLGPFGDFFFELRTLDELHTRAFGEALFKTTDRPREFGWLLRPSQGEWDAFIHQLDKLISENLRSEALNRLGVPKVNAAGQPLGTLNRLALLLEQRKVPSDQVARVLQPFREVRGARQKPAHALRSNVSDQTFVHKQVDLLERVSSSMFQLRSFWQSHPSNSDWEEPEYIEGGHRYRL